MKALIYDGLQIAGLGLVVAGSWALWGWGSAALIAGAALIVLPMLELHLLRRG